MGQEREREKERKKVITCRHIVNYATPEGAGPPLPSDYGLRQRISTSARRSCVDWLRIVFYTFRTANEPTMLGDPQRRRTSFLSLDELAIGAMTIKGGSSAIAIPLWILSHLSGRSND